MSSTNPTDLTLARIDQQADQMLASTDRNAPAWSRSDFVMEGLRFVFPDVADDVLAERVAAALIAEGA